MIGALRVANLQIILEETTLADVQNRFAGMIGYRGDAGDSLSWLCYYGTDADGEWILWLTSGEMNGLTQIDGLQWRRITAHQRPDHRCSKLSKNSGGIELPIPLHLGSSEQQVRQGLRFPTFARNGVLFFDHEHPVILRKEKYTASNDVAVVIRGGLVWAIGAWKITSS